MNDYNRLAETADDALTRLHNLTTYSPNAVTDPAARVAVATLRDELQRRLAGGERAWKLAALIQAQLDATINRTQPLPPLPKPPNFYHPITYHNQQYHPSGDAPPVWRRCAVEVWSRFPAAPTDDGQALVNHCHMTLLVLDHHANHWFESAHGRDATRRWITTLQNLLTAPAIITMETITA